MNKRAFVVGAASGMGLAAARELNAAGIDMVQRLCSPLGAKGLRICSDTLGCIDTPMGALEMSPSETSREALLSAPVPRSGTSE